MKKQFAIIAILLALCILGLVLAACSSESGDSPRGDSNYDVLDPSEDGKIVRRETYVNMESDGDDVQKIVDQILIAAKNNGATLGYEYFYSGDRNNAYLGFKVENDKADAFVAAVKAVCKDNGGDVVAVNKTITDVTSQYASDDYNLTLLQNKLAEYKKLQQESGLSYQDKIQLIDQIATTEKAIAELQSTDNKYYAADCALVTLYVGERTSAWEIVIPLAIALTLPAGVVVAIVLLAVNLGKQKHRADRLQKQIDGTK